jgi:glutamine amidotransferase
MTVAIVKYNAGNVFSVVTALERLGVQSCVTDDPITLSSASRVIFPGVGEAGSAMRYLRDRELDTVLRDLTVPFLGLCLGFQLMCAHSEEGDVECLGIFPARVRRLTVAPKVPHVGWSMLETTGHPVVARLGISPYTYFVHSYRVDIGRETIARCLYGEEFAAAAAIRNFVGVQFHPEKSGEIGARILRNFVEWSL